MDTVVMALACVAIGVLLDLLRMRLLKPMVVTVDVDHEESAIKRIEILVRGAGSVAGVALTDSNGERTMVLD